MVKVSSSSLVCEWGGIPVDWLSDITKIERTEQREAFGSFSQSGVVLKEAIESEGYTADIVLDDFMNFDMRKSRKEITEKQAR